MWDTNSKTRNIRLKLAITTSCFCGRKEIFDSDMSTRLGILLVASSIVAGLLVSCRSPRPDGPPASAEALVWPPPPDEPRIAYVKSIATPRDIGRSPSAWKRAISFITGAADERESLVKPLGIALDEAGNVCITDTGNNTVCYLDLAGKRWRRWAAAGKTRFESPVSVARAGDIFYLADSELGIVLAFREDGREVFRISSPLKRPAGVAVVGDSLAVADSAAHTVFVFDLRGQPRVQFGKHGDGPGEFNFPTHVAADSQGHLLVTDSLNSRVQVFDRAGKFLAQIGSAGDAPGQFGRPKGVAADTFGHVYVVDAVFDNVQVFDLTGRLLLNWGEGGSKPGTFGVPAGIAIGQDNQIYVADSYNHRVQVFKYLGQ
jgi:DNA-binding beta-propeller fold protein YncE